MTEASKTLSQLRKEAADHEAAMIAAVRAGDTEKAQQERLLLECSRKSADGMAIALAKQFRAEVCPIGR